METKFYELSQNNSGGSFAVDDKVCHRLIIEAESEDRALAIAEDLGCYWDGCESGLDCPCCGDRWYPSSHPIDIAKINKQGGYEVVEYGEGERAESEWFKRFGDLPRDSEPVHRTRYGSKVFIGKVKFDTVEQYAQFMADEYGWTSPDVRIFYKDGTVKEIFSKKVETRKKK